MKKKDDAHQSHDQAFFQQGALQVINGPQNKAGTIIHWPDTYPFRQSRFDLRQPLFDPVNHSQGILPITHDDDPADCLTRPVIVEEPASKLGSDGNPRHIFLTGPESLFDRN